MLHKKREEKRNFNATSHCLYVNKLSLLNVEASQLAFVFLGYGYWLLLT